MTVNRASIDGQWPKIGADTTLAERVYIAVRRRLASGDFPRLTFIREKDLAEGMAVSRTPVREALNRLESEGFLERIPHRGFRVPNQSLEHLAYFYPVLGTLEVLAGELAFPHLTESDIAELEAVNARYASSLATNDVNAAIEWNDEFHRCLAQKSGNPILCDLLEDLRGQIRRLELWDFANLLHPSDGRQSTVPADEWPRQHAAILQAVRNGELDKARELLRQNRSLVFQEEMKQVREVVPSVPEVPAVALLDPRQKFVMTAAPVA